MSLIVPHAFECGACGAVHNTSDARFPVGWSKCGGAVWCHDCTAAGVPAREIGKARRSGRKAA